MGIVGFQRKHARVLYDFLEPYYSERVTPLMKQLTGACPVSKFDMIWYIFEPGTEVYVNTEVGCQMCVVEQITSNLDKQSDERRVDERLRYWDLSLWYLTSDGKFVGRVKTAIRIGAYSGERKLISLPVCPIEIWDAHDKGDRRRKIMSRSRLLFKSLKLGFLLSSYSGPVVGRSGDFTGTVVLDCGKGLSQTNSRPPKLGQVDPMSAVFHPYDYILVNNRVHDEDHDMLQVDKTPRETPRSDSESDDSDSSRSEMAKAARINSKSYHSATMILPEDSHLKRGVPEREICDELSEHQLLLLFPTAWAFAFKTKQWIVIHPDNIVEIEKSTDSIENLILGEDELKTIKALSSRQSSTKKTWAADFIEGKGTGQIVLLHGPPGVGKTYTAEAIAQWLHRPLLTLTVADIGTVETRVERELLKWFSLAEAWNAVLLVDEADIFLERRQNRDLARNGLVSAFLRRMEYFRGLLFLTTNRVGQIDDAFISRVHIAIGYEHLSSENRAKIWEGFFKKLAKERPGKIQIAPGAKRWVLDNARSGTAQLNGRDIRNALQTAITLAEAECEEDPDFVPDTMAVIVEESHFKRVLEISNKFHKYVESIREADEKRRAIARQDRNDFWTVSGDAEADA
ncbi:P-loop containing nucleoside triphosphate hydrolase protein [Xylariomycetidae sp. FL2044]|nr:P-loop containing nucleoside triphosphate hydrolase protein [Xylariomycetidae sp. FL2044]